MAAETEAGFQRAVVELAEVHGWLTYHTHDSRRSNAGFPDLVLVRPPRVVVAELKTEKGRMSAPQRAWLEALQTCASEIHHRTVTLAADLFEVHLWRPSDWQTIERVLARTREPRRA